MHVLFVIESQTGRDLPFDIPANRLGSSIPKYDRCGCIEIPVGPDLDLKLMFAVVGDPSAYFEGWMKHVFNQIDRLKGGGQAFEIDADIVVVPSALGELFGRYAANEFS